MKRVPFFLGTLAAYANQKRGVGRIEAVARSVARRKGGKLLSVRVTDFTEQGTTIEVDLQYKGKVYSVPVLV